MPKQFKKDFKTGKIIAHVRKKENGVFEIRCQINGKRIGVSSKNLETAKAKFIVKLRELAEMTFAPAPIPTPVPAPVPAPVPVKEPEVIEKPIILNEYMKTWLEVVKKPVVKPVTLREYNYIFKNHISPVLGEKEIKNIKPFEVQDMINSLVNQGKLQTAKEVKNVLSALLDYAVIDDVIAKSPMAKVVVPHFEHKDGKVISREEEKKIIEILKNGGDKYAQAYVFMLYTGLRRSELASAQIIGDWIHVISAKNKKGYKEKTRTIPVSPMLKPLLAYIDIAVITAISNPCLTAKFKNYFPEHHLHETRHTFITRCQECGIKREIVSLWVGHAADSSITTAVYTHLETNKNIQLEEIAKFYYEL